MTAQRASTSISATEELYERGQRVLPGGVTAAARANAAIGHPFYVARAEGPYLFDPDGNRFIETCMSNGGTLLGHGHPAIVAAVHEAAHAGFACGYDGEPQIRLAERLVGQIPAFEMVRFTGSGTEATFYAIRIARAFTGRTRVLKFAGHFHGYNDPLAFNLWARPAEANRDSMPSLQTETLGLPTEATSDIVVAPYNNVEALLTLLDRHEGELAAIIMEPINFDAGGIRPEPGYLELVREETRKRGIVLIFDEILSGYRTGPGGAQAYLGVTPDLATFGKAVAGGLPLSVIGGRRDIMSVVSPLGGAVHTGTYNAHLLPVMAAHAFLNTIEEPGFWERLLALHDRLYAGMAAAFANGGLPVRIQGIGARFGMFFGLNPATKISRHEQAAASDQELLRQFCREMHQRGVYVNPAWHHGISAMHDDSLVDSIIDATESSARAIAR